MLKIKIIALGKFKEKAYVELEKEFLKRLSPFAKIKVVELPEVSYGKNPDLQKVKEQEAAAIVRQLSDDAVVILLEEKGALRDSKEFSKFLERIGGMGRALFHEHDSGMARRRSADHSRDRGRDVGAGGAVADS